jgi:hypothetical protein
MRADFQPIDLDDAVNHIIGCIKNSDQSIEFLQQYENDERGFLGQLHMFYGRGLRNEWYLWWFKDHKYDTWPDKKPSIVQWFNDHQIYHADDMSGIILTTVYRRYFDKPIELEKQIERYHKHWLRQCGTINPMNY